MSRRFRRDIASLGVVAALCLGLLMGAVAKCDADAIPPSVPEGFRVRQVECSRVTLCWDASTDRGGSGLKGYRLYRDGKIVTQPTGTCINNWHWLLPSTRYSYAVSAIDNVGNESAQSVLEVTTPPIPPIKNPLRIDVVLLKFPDFAKEPFELDHASSVVFHGPTSVNAYYQEASYNRTSVVGDSYGWFILPKTAQEYGGWQHDNGLWYGLAVQALLRDAKKVAQKGTARSAPDVTFYVIHGLGTAGLTGAQSVILSATLGFRLGVMLHELGHALGHGVGHASTWNCGDDAVGPNIVDEPTEGGCTVWRYTDNYDPMGGGQPYHYSSYHKEILGMLPAENIAIAAQDGEYVLDQLELPSTGIKELKIPLDKGIFYFLEYRTPVGFDSETPPKHLSPIDGVMLRLRVAHYFGTDGSTYLPTPKGKASGLVLNPGTPFYDPYRRIRVEVLSKGGGRATVRITGRSGSQRPRSANPGDRGDEVGNSGKSKGT